MSPIIQEIIDKLKKYPAIAFTATDNSITVKPKDDNGFVVSLEVGENNIIVSGDVWHEHFDSHDEENAMNCFAFLLSDDCRLKVVYKGDKPKTWTLESFKNGQWVSDSSTGLLNVMFWQPTRVKYFQNEWIKVRGSLT